MTIPKILLVVTFEPADKAHDGNMTRGDVRDVYANLPARYFDIEVCEWEVTERDETGVVTALTCDPKHSAGETPFLVFGELLETSELPTRNYADGTEEWVVMFWHADEVHHALVLKASDVIVAAGRVKQEFPLCRIIQIEELETSGHPMGYLDTYEIILPVGGRRVPRASETAQ